MILLGTNDMFDTILTWGDGLGSTDAGSIF